MNGAHDMGGMDGFGPVEIGTEGPKFDPPTYTKPEGRGRGEGHRAIRYGQPWGASDSRPR